MADPLLTLDADQQVSAVQKNTPQNDRWRAGQIAPHRGHPFTLVIVADGEGSEKAGDSANQAVEIAFAEAEFRRDDPLPKLLKHLVHQMNEVIAQRGTGDTAGVTLAAIQGDEVWLVQAGRQTRCYQVRGERSVTALTDDNEYWLGRGSPAPELEPASHKLKRGDKLVFCTDGLFAGDLVKSEELARIDRYQDVKGAARHLSAMAMGRNVNDNVTVVVAAYGRRRGWPLRVLAFDLVGVILAVLIVTSLGTFIANYARVLPRPPDLGIAVLAEGAAAGIEQFQTIYPGTDITATSTNPIHLRLKRRESLDSSLTASIPDVDLYLGTGSFAHLTSLDVQGFMDAQNGILQPTNLTEIRLNQGSALILSQADRTFYVWLDVGENPREPLIILKGEKAALGISREGGQINAFCFEGSCSIHSGRLSESFPESHKISFNNAITTLEGLSFLPLEPSDWDSWRALCSAPQADPQAVRGTCRILLP